MQLDVKALGTEMGALIAEIVAPLQKRIEQLEARQPERGEKGEPGADADPKEIVRELIATNELAPILELHVAKAVEEFIAQNPPAAGKDGAPGRDGRDGDRGAQGEKGAPGADGKDGIGLAGAMIDRDGNLMITLTNGDTKSLGPVVGRDGAPGKDGADFSGFEVDYDGERTLTIRGKGGEITKHLPIPLDRGYYRDGMKAEQGDILTHNGDAWIALKGTAAKPCRENAEDWRLFARKGRDGRDGKDGKPPPGPVKLAGYQPIDDGRSSAPPGAE